MKCYNGCPDEELQAILDDEAKCDAQLKKINAHATYFPLEEMWKVYATGGIPIPLSKFHNTKRDATNEALKNFKNKLKENK